MVSPILSSVESVIPPHLLVFPVSLAIGPSRASIALPIKKITSEMIIPCVDLSINRIIDDMIIIIRPVSDTIHGGMPILMNILAILFIFVSSFSLNLFSTSSSLSWIKNIFWYVGYIFPK